MLKWMMLRSEFKCKDYYSTKTIKFSDLVLLKNFLNGDHGPEDALSVGLHWDEATPWLR